jgi:hypothetical protein
LPLLDRSMIGNGPVAPHFEQATRLTSR